jgi:alpha-galactosidase
LQNGELTLVLANPPPAGGRGGFGGRGNANAPTVLKKTSDASEFHMPAELAHRPLEPLQPIPANGLAQTPPMGWNSWNKFNVRIDDKTMREIADAMVASGMRDAGYVYLTIDDTWEGRRDASGVLHANEKFPDMKALADYLHSKGLKLGIYSGPGLRTCQRLEASYGHEEIDAKTWAAWGVDYLKYDWCVSNGVYGPEEMPAAYQKMANALRSTGRPIVFSLCQYGWLNVGEWGAAAGGNLWRTTGDISDNWNSMSTIGFGQNGREKYAGPGHWNDPDMLEIGNSGMSTTEYRTHMSLWSMLAAPLIAGHDVRSMPDAIRDILTNREAIAIDQDKLGKQGFRLRQDGETEVWEKPLADGVAVALFNRGGDAARMSVKWSEVGVTKSNPKVRDVWKHQDVNAPSEFTAEVPWHGVVLLTVK